MFYKPTALPCGHVLCLPCLARTLDHAFQKQVNCPLCRSSLNKYLYFLNSKAQMAQNNSDVTLTDNENGEKMLVHGSAMIPVEKLLHQLLLRNFPEEYKKRSLMARTEEAPSSPHVVQMPQPAVTKATQTLQREMWMKYQSLFVEWRFPASHFHCTSLSQGID